MKEDVHGCDGGYLIVLTEVVFLIFGFQVIILKMPFFTCERSS